MTPWRNADEVTGEGHEMSNERKASITRWGRDDAIARNVEIVKAVLSGKTSTEVAHAFGLTTERARQITAKYCRLANPIAYARMPEHHLNVPWLRENRDEFLPRMPTRKNLKRNEAGM